MKIGGINFYAGNKRPVADLGLIKSLHLDAIGMQEAYRRFSLIKNALSTTYNVYAKPEAGMGGKETLVAVSKRYKVIDHYTYKVSDFSQKRIGPKRYVTVVVYEGRRKKNVWAIINVHMNAAIVNRDTGRHFRTTLPRIREYVDAMGMIEKEIKKQKAAGRHVVVTGDFNYPKTRFSRLWKWSPHQTFKRCGLVYHQEHLDYIAWSRGLRKVSLRKISPERTGSDHPWLIIDLRPVA